MARGHGEPHPLKPERLRRAFEFLCANRAFSLGPRLPEAAWDDAKSAVEALRQEDGGRWGP